METLPFKVVKALGRELHIECPHCGEVAAFELMELNPQQSEAACCPCGAVVKYVDRVSVKSPEARP